MVSLFIARKENKSQKIMYPKKSIFNFEERLYEEEISVNQLPGGKYHEETTKVIELKNPPKKVSGAV